MEDPEVVETTLLPSPISLGVISFPRKKNYPTCPMCGIMFLKEMDMRKHLTDEQWVSYSEEKYQDFLRCEECCLFFETSKGYMQHYGKVHETKYKYSKCSICRRKFKNKYAVKFHIKQVHQKTTREECPGCGKEFYNKYLIPKHLLKCKRSRHS